MRSSVVRPVAAGVVAAVVFTAALLSPHVAAQADTVTSTIPVGSGPFSAAVTPDGSTVYVGSSINNGGLSDSGSVSVVDTASNTMTTKFTTGSVALLDLTVSPDGSRLYTGFRTGMVRAIDTATNTVVVSAAAGSSVYGIAVSPDGTRLYTADFIAGFLRVLDATTLAVIGSVSVGTAPRGIAISADGALAYVANQGATTGNSNPGSVSVVDLATNTVVATVPTGLGTWAVALSPDGTQLYASDRGSNTISVIDVATNAVTGTIPVGSAPFRIAFTPDGTRAYVVNQVDDTVSVVRTSTMSVVSTIPVGDQPSAITISPDGLTAYVANQLANSVSVLAIDTYPAVTTTVLADGTAGSAYTASIATTGRPTPSLAVTGGTLPPGLALDPSGALTGTPTTAGTFTFTVTANSSVSGIPASDDQVLTLTIAPDPRAVLVAVDDDFPAAVPASGGPVGNVLANDTLNGAAVDSAAVAVTLTDSGGIVGATVGADGVVTIPAGVAAGTYTLSYQICERAFPDNCAAATLTVLALADTGDQTRVLASTGATVLAPAAIAVLAFGLGAALLALRRRQLG